MDRISSEQRSRNMSEVKSKNTSPEMYLRKLLFAEGFRYRVHSEKVPGHPDIWIKRYNTAIFVHGCFWHQHEGCKRATVPQTRAEFWKSKFTKNRKRDIKVADDLKSLGIKRLVVWECTIKKMQKDKDVERQELHDINDFIKFGQGCLEI